MKAAAAILIVIWTSVMVQPVFAYFGGKSAYGECSKTVPSKPGCSKTKSASSACSKKKGTNQGCSSKKNDEPSKSQNEKNCKSEGCNPTLGCSSGNFYIHHQYQIFLPSWFEQKQEANVMNDNRIIKNMSECWHPPEA